MANYTETMRARNKPRLRLHSDGLWYCYRNHRTAFGLYLGRVTGAGNTPYAAWKDLAELERENENSTMGMPMSAPRGA